MLLNDNYLNRLYRKIRARHRERISPQNRHDESVKYVFSNEDVDK